MTRPTKFAPHDYATYLTADGNWRSDRSMLYHWSGTHWTTVRDVSANAAAYHWLVTNQPDHVSPENAVRAVRAAIMFLPDLPEASGVTPESLVVPCRNGYVHVPRAGNGPIRLEPADKSLGVQYVLAADYDPAAEDAPLFDSFLERAIPWAEVRARVQEYIGYTLLPDTRFQRAQLWLGDGANGKGVLANIVQALHGTVAAVRLDDLAGFKLSGLVGASLVYCDEVPKGRIDEQLIKSLIAGERVQVDRKHQQPLSLRLQGKWLVLGNHVPVVTDHSVGFWRRWDLVPFGATVPERDRDPTLSDKIIFSELPAVLNWALRGLARLLSRNGFSPELPGPMFDLLRNAKTESNSILSWITDMDVVPIEIQDGDVGKQLIVRKSWLYSHYKEWCGENGVQAFSAMKWWQYIEKSYGDAVQLKRKRGRPTDNPDWFCNLVPKSGALCVPDVAPDLA